MKTENRRILRLPAAAAAGLAALAVTAAVLYEADTAYFGHTAGPVINQASIQSGNAVAYVPWFDTEGYPGDLLASPVSTAGTVDLTTTTWRAAEVMDAAEALNPGSFWDTGRFIVTTNTAGTPVPFRKDTLDSTQISDLNKDQDKLIKYLRGDRSEEGGTFGRVRTSLLGAIIHSNPVYVGAPDSGYSFDGYLAFAKNNAARAPRVYVGANDGMLHAFDAATGRETFAYIPSTLMSKLPALAQAPYTNQYFVDGPLTVADVYFSDAWHTVLVGTLGHGGKGVFALDVTSAAAITSEANTAAGAGSRVLWELDTADVGGGNLGYTHGKAVVGKMANGAWMAVVANGYDSASGVASLLFLDIGTGSVIREITVSDNSDNGMSAPALVDVDNDAIVDYAYAGDLNGNLWKFDLTDPIPANWAVAGGGSALFKAEAGHSITVAPEVGVHPRKGYMVYAATGRMLSSDDTTDSTNGVVYGVWDKGWAAADLPLTVDLVNPNFVTQTMAMKVMPGIDKPVRVASDAAVDWDSRVGWRVPLNATDEGAAGWRVLTDIGLRGGRLHFTATSPLDLVGRNWYLQLDAMSGGAPDQTIIDVNKDGSLDTSDNVDGNGDSLVTNVAEDRVVGVQKRIGLASAPTFASLNGYSDAALFNHLAQISQVHEDVVAGATGEDAGLLGGHIDVDVASQSYEIDNGSTDQHTHEWDDKFDTTVIDLFDILGGYRSIDDAAGEPGMSPTKPFLITIANAHLSTAGVLEINGVGTPVVEHRQLIKRVLSNNTLDGDRAPLYTLSVPSDAQYSAGVRQLTSLKLRFPSAAIMGGGVIGTVTGCVRGNDRGVNDEYRNGALTVQLLDASVGLDASYAYDAVSETYYKVGGGSHRIHRLGYAVPYDLGSWRIGDGMMHETTVFWHWGGGCYTPGDELSYAADFLAEVGREFAPSTDDSIGDGRDAPADDPPSGDDDPGWDEQTTSREVSTEIIAAFDRVGRLFWREVVPEN